MMPRLSQPERDRAIGISCSVVSSDNEIIHPETQQQLREALEEEWAAIPQDQLRHYRLKTKLRAGPVDGPSCVKTYREDIRQILFKEFNNPISDLEIGVVVRKAFPRHTRKGKYYFGIRACNTKYADETGRTISTDNPKSLMTIQSDGESRETSPVMLKPVKKRAIQAWKETENGQAFAADQMIRDANTQAPAPIFSVAPNDGLVRPPWRPMLVLPQHLRMPPRGMLFPVGRPPGTIPIPHAVMTTREPNNINRSLAPSRVRKRTNVDVGAFQKMSYDRTGKKPRKEGAMIELSSSHNGLIAERTNLAAMRTCIKPIILDFEVPMPKLPLSSLSSATGTHASKKEIKSGDLSSTAEGRLDRVPVSQRTVEGAESSPSKQGSSNKSSVGPLSGNSPGSKRVLREESCQSVESKPDNPFKKPDINNYRTNVSAGRCFMCQNPIPPNASKDASPLESAILAICMKCKKVAMSGSESCKPVPKFPFACNPKLAPRTVYIPPPRRIFRPKPPPLKGPMKAVGIRLYPPRSRSTSSTSQRSPGTTVPSPLAPPKSPGQLSMPGSPAPSLPVGSPQPCSPALMIHSAPPSPRHVSDAGVMMQSLSLPPSPSMIPQHSLSPGAVDPMEPDTPRRPLPSASLQVPSPAYSSSPSTSGGRDSCSSERLSLPPGREQDDATIKALLQLGRGVERTASEHSADNIPVPSPMSRLPDRDTVLQPYPTCSVPIPHSTISLPQIALTGSLPLLAGQVPMIPSNAGVVMGPQGQLLPIVPSWPPLGVPTSEAMNMISAAGFPPMPFFIQPPVTRESSSPTVSVHVAPPGLIPSDIRSRSLLDPAKTSAGPTPDSHPYDSSQIKYRKGFKRSRVSEGITDSPTDHVSYRADSTQEDKSKSKQSIVIVGTNCGGSSSVKLNNDSKEASYHQGEVPREAPEMYGKPFSTFCCRCSGREIMLLRCTDCDFLCNNKFGMELHIAAQRHAESRNKTSLLEVINRRANEADDRDEIASQSSVETQSADTDTDAASPPPIRVQREVPWSLVPETSRLPHPPWQENVLHLMPGRIIPQETLASRTSQTSFVASSSYNSFGTVTENTVPLDLSGRTFQPMPYLPGLPTSSFQLKEQRKDGSVEELSPLDLSGYSRSPIMSTAGGSVHQFLSNRKLGTQSSFTAKKTQLDLISSQQPLHTPNLLSTTSSGKKMPQPQVPQTFFDLMRLHNMPIPTTAVTSTVNSSKNLQSPISSRIPSMRPLTGPSSLSVTKTPLESPLSPKSYSIIPSIVLSSITSASVPKCAPYPTTELTRPPPGIITSPNLTQPQSLNYQGGTISIRPTIPVPQMLVSSKTVPVLSPFPLPVPVLASAMETRSSPGREYSNMELLNVNVGSPNVHLGSPSRGSPNVQDSPQGRQKYSVLESPREYSSRKDLSPYMAPQHVHIKIEPPDSRQEAEYAEQDGQEHRWCEEAEKQARLLEASLATGVTSPTCPNHSLEFISGRSGIGRTSWEITTKSLQIRDNTYVNATTGFSKSLQSPDGPLSMTSPGHDLNNGATCRLSSGMHRTNALARESAQGMSPTAENYPEMSREYARNPEDNSPSGRHASLNSSSPNTSRQDMISDSIETRSDALDPPTLHIKLEK